MREKKALLVGSSFSAAPILFALKKYGLRVTVCGRNRDDPCHHYADSSCYVDYSRHEELLGILDTENFDYLVPTCNDYSYMSCSHVAGRYGFPGFDDLPTASTLHTKGLFRQLTQKLAIPSPRHVEIAGGQPPQAEGLRYPLLVKPVDSFSGRGMTKVAQPVELAPAIEVAKQASRDGGVVVEEFVDGSLHSHSAFLEDGRIAVDFFVDEFCTVYPYQVNCSNHPSSLSETLKYGIRECIAKIADAMELTDGLIHTQFMTDGQEFWVVETMRRCPGDLYGALISLSTRVDYADLFVRPYLGMKLPDIADTSPLCYARHTVTTKSALAFFSFSHNVPGERIDIVPLKESGKYLEAAPFDKVGIVFARFRDLASMHATAPNMADLVSIEQLGVHL